MRTGAATALTARSSRYVRVAFLTVAVGFNLWTLRAELAPPQYINDTAIHSALVDWTATRLETGRSPLDGWFPYLSFGAERFRSYQSLPYLITGAVAVATGESVFAWVSFLLLVLWPLAVFASARLFEMDVGAAATAALVSPVVWSASGFGFEHLSYTWYGPGLWAQLWGMWTFPFALALTWRAVARRGSLAVAALAVGMTILLHLPTGYLALVAIPVIVVADTHHLGSRIARASLVLLGGLALAAWQIAAMVQGRPWTGVDTSPTTRYRWDSFGIGQVMSWLLRGDIFDWGRLPVVSVLAAVGLGVAIRRWTTSEGLRVVVLVGVASLLLFFGRPTLGPVAELLPAGESLSFRRFVVGVHLSGILLAGVGAWWMVCALVERLVRTRGLAPIPALALGAGVLLVVTVPAFLDIASLHRYEARLMHRQRLVDAGAGSDFQSLLRRAEADDAVRLYAGSNSIDSTGYRLGLAPAYISLLELGPVDILGYRRPTWSLLSAVEERFDPNVAAQYELFGVTHAILPEEMSPPPGARRVAEVGDLVLWRTSDAAYVDVGSITEPVRATAATLAHSVAPYLSSAAAGRGEYPGIAFDGGPPPPVVDAGPAARVISSRASPAAGAFEASIDIAGPGAVVLRETYDPGWVATVDGIARDVWMVAPGFPAVVVEPGRHVVVFHHGTTSQRWPWFVLGIGAIAALVAADVTSRRQRTASPVR
jgi:hypothetical protein